MFYLNGEKMLLSKSPRTKGESKRIIKRLKMM